MQYSPDNPDTSYAPHGPHKGSLRAIRGEPLFGTFGPNPNSGRFLQNPDPQRSEFEHQGPLLLCQD